jgi:predicted ferric reductase
VLVLLIYWIIIIILLTSNAIVKDAYFWERIGFRAAWVSVMQVPLLYLLSTRRSVIATLIGSSHERLNWLHRWVARTIVITGAIHGFHFYTEWVRADLVELELEMMSSIVPYGFGAWAVLAWTLLVSLAPLRRLAYEVFVFQHIAAAAIFLWLLYVHLPSYARYYVWFAVAAWSFDRLCRLVTFMWVNFLPPKPTEVSGTCCCKTKRLPLGHPTDVRVVNDQVAVVTIHNIRTQLHGGQHLYVWFPRLGLFETHPYTVMNASPCGCGLQLVVRKQKGFSRRLHNFAQKAEGGVSKTTAFVNGPYGSPAAWRSFDTLVLISGSTGASFILSILQDVLRAEGQTCVRRIHFLSLARDKSELDFYAGQIRLLMSNNKQPAIKLKFTLAITGSDSKFNTSLEVEEKVGESTPSPDYMEVMRAPASGRDIENGKAVYTTSCYNKDDGASNDKSKPRLDLQYIYSRCDVERFIQKPVEAAYGETSVVVCGGGSLTCKVRNVVSKLSDERAVHKGSGLQGIHLYVEEYSL